MKRSNAKPGVEVIRKDGGSRFIIRDAPLAWTPGFEPEIPLMEVGDNNFWTTAYPSELRLANKPKRSELVKRIAELEALISNDKDVNYEALRYTNEQLKLRGEELEQRIGHLNLALSEAHNESARRAQVIERILSGDYFKDRPHRERWQHVADVTGWTIKSTFNSDRILVEVTDARGFNTELTGTWTDEPFESRVVGPASGQGGENE